MTEVKSERNVDSNYFILQNVDVLVLCILKPEVTDIDIDVCMKDYRHCGLVIEFVGFTLFKGTLVGIVKYKRTYVSDIL